MKNVKVNPDNLTNMHVACCYHIVLYTAILFQDLRSSLHLSIIDFLNMSCVSQHPVPNALAKYCRTIY